MKFWKTVQVFDVAAFTKEREKSGIPARQVALDAGVTPTFLCDLEKGRRGVTDEVAAKLIASLGKLKAARKKPASSGKEM